MCLRKPHQFINVTSIQVSWLIMQVLRMARARLCFMNVVQLFNYLHMLFLGSSRNLLSEVTTHEIAKLLKPGSLAKSCTVGFSPRG